MTTHDKYPDKPGKKKIFVKRFWHKHAKRYIYASESGKTAFCIYIDA